MLPVSSRRNDDFPHTDRAVLTRSQKVEFDEDDASVYGPNERGQTEDLSSTISSWVHLSYVKSGKRTTTRSGKLIFKTD